MFELFGLVRPENDGDDDDDEGGDDDDDDGGDDGDNDDDDEIDDDGDAAHAGYYHVRHAFVPHKPTIGATCIRPCLNSTPTRRRHAKSHSFIFLII